MQPSPGERFYMDQQEQWRIEEMQAAAQAAAVQAAALAASQASAVAVQGSTIAAASKSAQQFKISFDRRPTGMQYRTHTFEIGDLAITDEQAAAVLHFPLEEAWGTALSLVASVSTSKGQSYSGDTLWWSLATSVDGANWALLSTLSPSTSWHTATPYKGSVARLHGPFGGLLRLNVTSKRNAELATAVEGGRYCEVKVTIGAQFV